jgi:hypothetical protein
MCQVQALVVRPATLTLSEKRDVQICNVRPRNVSNVAISFPRFRCPIGIAWCWEKEIASQYIAHLEHFLGTLVQPEGRKTK